MPSVTFTAPGGKVVVSTYRANTAIHTAAIGDGTFGYGYLVESSGSFGAYTFASDSQTNPSPQANASQRGFLGDYSSIAAAPSGNRVLMTWSDTRNSNSAGPDEDIFLFSIAIPCRASFPRIDGSRTRHATSPQPQRFLALPLPGTALTGITTKSGGRIRSPRVSRKAANFTGKRARKVGGKERAFHAFPPRRKKPLHPRGSTEIDRVSERLEGAEPTTPMGSATVCDLAIRAQIAGLTGV